MNKELKKAITTELHDLVANALSKRNMKAAGEIADHIKDAARHIARKFVKHLPENNVPKVKKANAGTAKTAKKKSATVAKKKKTVKKAATAAKKSTKKAVARKTV